MYLQPLQEYFKHNKQKLVLSILINSFFINKHPVIPSPPAVADAAWNQLTHII